MGELHHFLGMTISRTSDGLLLYQRQYMLDLLDRAGINDGKQCSTHVDTQSKLAAVWQALSVSHFHQSGYSICCSANLLIYA
jgi:hypothetical protein